MTNITKYNEMILKYGKDVIDDVRAAVKNADGNLRYVFDTYQKEGKETHAICLDEYFFGK